MKVLKNIDQVRHFTSLIRSVGKTVGFVPTMGNLHQGHVSLVERAKQENSIVGVSIFVNPTQFGPTEDYNKYPRTLEADVEKLEKAGCDFVFFPEVKTMYKDGVSDVFVTEKYASTVLCGKFRPGHFDGVLTVVSKLLNICNPSKAYFGMKDYQQLVLIKEMVKALNMDVEIIPCPIIREQDGLAMSSRNSYLINKDRENALKINEALNKIKEAFKNGEKDPDKLKKIGLEVLIPKIAVQYLELLDPDGLKKVDNANSGCLVAVAGYCGQVRLIDNIIL